MSMHDDDDLDRTSDALLAKIRVVGDQVTAVMQAATTFATARRDGLADLDTLGRPLLHDLRSLASVLATLADGLQQTADDVTAMLTSR
jgi:hypothetical protein